MRQNVLLLLITLFCFSLNASPAERIAAWIALGDFSTAAQEARDALQHDSRNTKLWRLYIESVAQKRENSHFFKEVSSFIKMFPEEKKSRWLHEVVAWHTLKKGSASHNPMTRLYAYYGAASANDARALPVLVVGMEDSHPAVRALVAQMLGSFRDVELQQLVRHHLKKERHPDVRIPLIGAVGKMKVVEEKETLQHWLRTKTLTGRETKACVEALIALNQETVTEETRSLLEHSRAEVRAFGCYALCEYDEGGQETDAICALLEDSCADVRAALIQSLGLLSERGEVLQKALPQAVQESYHAIAVPALWLEATRGHFHKRAFQHWVHHQTPDIRHFSAALLGATGSIGNFLAMEELKASQDPLVQINLALGLLRQRKNSEEVVSYLLHALKEVKNPLMWQKEGVFKYLTYSTVHPHPLIPHYPQTVDLMTRLELIQVLGMFREKEALTLAKEYLGQTPWGVSSVASSLFLTEGDETAIFIVEKLLEDPKRSVRLQAALILALWSQEESLVEILQNAYFSATYQEKAYILEGLGKMRSQASIPFLFDLILKTPHNLQILAASALLQCLSG